jgi:hypothetical protein
MSCIYCRLRNILSPSPTKQGDLQWELTKDVVNMSVVRAEPMAVKVSHKLR